MTTKRNTKSSKIKGSVKKVKQPKLRSFHISKSPERFVTFKLTKQTLYWLILLIYILVLNVLIVNSQIKAALAIN